MQKILALDPGDQWVGTAVSDALGLTAKPYKTVTLKDIKNFIHQETARLGIQTIIIGYPLTLKGTESEQTKKVVALKNSLEQEFPHLSFILWDERLTSKRADTLKHAKTKEEKLEAHSVAAAFILQSYLDYLYQKQQQ
ncbi:MAG: Holliday junction resolvase RuvX [Candidatus Babeliales bacterium]